MHAYQNLKTDPSCKKCTDESINKHNSKESSCLCSHDGSENTSLGSKMKDAESFTASSAA